jgi:hypothetical protein
VEIVDRGRPRMTIWRMRIVCWLPKATHITIVCNTYYCSTATVFAWTFSVLFNYPVLCFSTCSELHTISSLASAFNPVYLQYFLSARHVTTVTKLLGDMITEIQIKMLVLTIKPTRCTNFSNLFLE